MNDTEAIEGRRPAPADVQRRPAREWLSGLAAFAVVTLGSGCLAAEPTSTLGSAFRPQGMVDAPAAGNAQPSGANLPGLRVVVSGASRSVASIDSQIVHVGDKVNGMRVMQISPHGVVLAGEGGALERLTISPSVVKRNVADKATRNSNGVRQ